MLTDAESISVLLVDDEQDFLFAVEKALRRRNFKVLTAACAEDARSIIGSKFFQVVVLDVKLPDGDGHQLFYEFKIKSPGTQFIMLTGHGNVQRAFEMSKEGVFDYLTKPVDIDELARRITLAAQESTAQVIAPAEEKKITVLLVDDETDFLISLKRVLARRGFNVHVAASGEAALKIVGDKNIDVAVVDVKMPGMSGIEVLMQMKTMQPAVEIILLTGHATMDSAVNGMKLGAFDYLFKPQDPEELTQKIITAAEKKQNSG